MSDPAFPHKTDSAMSVASAGDQHSLTRRVNSRDLFQQMREIEIEHEGRIYRLRLTQLNKLILTA